MLEEYPLLLFRPVNVGLQNLYLYVLAIRDLIEEVEQCPDYDYLVRIILGRRKGTY